METNQLVLVEGQPLTLIMGDTSYRGNLQLREDGVWYVRLDSDDRNIEIHKRETSETL